MLLVIATGSCPKGLRMQGLQVAQNIRVARSHSRSLAKDTEQERRTPLTDQKSDQHKQREL
eukprot:3771837-Rhodomonas_salina.2